MRKLENKVAVVYGNGSVGGAIATAFAKEGAMVYLTGRTKSKLDAIAKEILTTGGMIRTELLDALDEKSIERHMDEVINKSGRVDISFNAIGLSQKGIQGALLAETALKDFMLPILTYTQSHFLTTKAALKRMVKEGHGVIIMHTPDAGKKSGPYVGGIIPAWAAMEGLNRSVSVEYAQQGIRSVCLRTTGIPETPLIDEVFDIHGRARGISFKDFTAVMENETQRKRLNTLQELTNAAVFVASDEGSAITGTVLNLTAGMVAD